MILRKLKEINRDQKGFNMIELTLAILVTGIISTGIVTTIFQTFEVNDSITNRKVAIGDVESAIFWLSGDAQVAQDINTSPGPDFLYLSWVEWDNTVHQVTYTIVGTEMLRYYTVTGGSSTNTTVAYFIDPSQTSCNFTDYILHFTATSTVGSFRPVTETRISRVFPRSYLR